MVLIEAFASFRASTTMVWGQFAFFGTLLNGVLARDGALVFGLFMLASIHTKPTVQFG